ncbi:TIGR02450 family Trp-rich protein [Marinomonas sp. C2222]|uniref:TIGR02450 family Trp-rich protein n=1 Tax=Marinomonas sargassi TaxID=2984494 RepID=A0ABT2YUS2_9GAMM|nr:TIGR02450 family Trp-rich protein [Marinomonas sargassi]MCV2403608.1 TIGR02450 family Trp-rich protein [Marinomonas sargassi]
MNQINPKKLHHSKWTAVKPIEKEKHFLVTKVEFDEEGVVTLCQLEAILSKRQYEIDWRELKNLDKWRYGWK